MVNTCPLVTQLAEGPVMVGTGNGLTVTVKLNGVPVHPFAVGVITYTTGTGPAVVFLNVSVNVAPVPLLARLLMPAAGL